MWLRITYVSFSLWSEPFLVESHRKDSLIWEDVHYLNLTET